MLRFRLSETASSTQKPNHLPDRGLRALAGRIVCQARSMHRFPRATACPAITSEEVRSKFLTIIVMNNSEAF